MKAVELFVEILTVFFVVPVIWILTGMLYGWVAGLLFGKILLSALAACGIKGVALWKLGALIGFIAVFFSKDPSSKWE